jgi:hypothetical protein
MEKKIITVLLLGALVGNIACKKDTCPSYMTKEEVKNWEKDYQKRMQKKKIKNKSVF